MNKKEKFFEELFEYLHDNDDRVEDVFSSDVIDFLERLQKVDILLAPIESLEPAAARPNKKSTFTEIGSQIMKFLQKEENKTKNFTAAEIGEQISISSRSVGSSITKLVNDNYVDKLTGKSPFKYQLTEKGVAAQIEE